eukprot:403363618
MKNRNHQSNNSATSKKQQSNKSTPQSSARRREEIDDINMMNTTSGSELELEQRFLLKGNVMAARNSLFDFFQFNSWIKKTNYEGIFNAMLVIAIMMLVHKPIGNWIRMGRPVEPQLINQIVNEFIYIIIANLYFFAFSFTAFFVQKAVIWGAPAQPMKYFQYVIEAVFLYSIFHIIKSNPHWPLSHFFFLSIHGQVILYKVHSYLLTNLELREKYLQQLSIVKKNKKDDSENYQQYPNNVNLIDFVFYLATPTMVYEVNFPRTYRFRFIQYMVFTEDIIPIVKSNLNVPIFELYLKLQMTIILMIILLIFLLFESLPNAVSELSLYADREFYQDWWNATSVEEFYGKWLRFAYLFFYRHVYMKIMIKYRMNPALAKAISNLISAVFQELIMIMSLQVYSCHLFKAQIVATIWSFIQNKYQPFSNETRNTIVLVGFLITSPLVITLYTWDYFHKGMPNAKMVWF